VVIDKRYAWLRKFTATSWLIAATANAMIAMSLPTSAQARGVGLGPLELGGMVRANALSKSWETRNRKFPLQGAEFDTLAGDLSFESGNWIGDAQYRFYYYTQTNQTTHFAHHAWAGYDFDEAGTLKAGLTKVPFGVLPFASNNYFFSLAYYVGLEDDYDVGVSYTDQTGPWRWDVAYFARDEGGFFGDSDASARYSYDIVSEGDSANKERHQFNARIERSLPSGAAGDTKLGLSLQYGRIKNTALNDSGDQFAVAGHLNGSYGPWSVKLESLYYNYDVKNPESQREDIVLMGAYDFSYEVAAEGQLNSLGVAYNLPVEWRYLDSITFYDDYSVLFKPDSNKATSQQNAVGMAIDVAGPLLVYTDFVAGRHNAWIGPNFTTSLGDGGEPQWHYRFNVNFGLYF